jgi:penicillin-binding protein-related factor A (putative recombinase)
MIIVLFRRKLRLREIRGKAFEALTYHQLKRLQEALQGRFWFHRLWDYKVYVAVNPKLRCFQQPADYLACLDGQLYFIECKSCKGERYEIRFIREHQEASADAVEKAGAIYWFLIYHWGDEIYALRPATWRALKDRAASAGRSSLHWDEIEDAADLVLRKDPYWDFSPLFSGKAGSPKHLMRKLPRKDIRYIYSSEFPAVAIYDSEEDAIFILTDLWLKVCWKRWSQNLGKFIDYIKKDLSVSIVHELIHWASEPLNLKGEALRRWEELVERVALALVHGGGYPDIIPVIDLDEKREVGK